MRVFVFSAGWLWGIEKLLRPGGRWRPMRLALTCFLIERPDGLVLVDTGYARATRESWWRVPGPFFQLLSPVEIGARETAADRVLSLGRKLEDVTDVICTHLDHDHAGGLADFPNARVHVLRDEKTRALGLWHPRYQPATFAHRPRFEAHDVTGRDGLLGFPRSKDLFGDGTVHLVWTPGHSPGHVAVAVRTDKGWLLHLGDSIYLEGELRDGDQGLGPAMRLLRRIADSDHTTARVTQRLLLQLVGRDDVTLIASHDERMLDRVPLFPVPIAEVR